MSRAVPVAQSTISRSLRILRELGLIEVFLAPHDGRIRLTRLSPLGRSFMTSLRDLVPCEQEKKTDRGGEMPRKSRPSG
ncbi:ArsR family transcriptional regulator [Stenotrophomonas sepilia]|uniref:ArsR family transcriptional regulator n=1 Tax=Stenotrophomonas sepilia TaxID=2860290 RepID=UPI00385070E1